jgi:hypothetical protein
MSWNLALHMLLVAAAALAQGATSYLGWRVTVDGGVLPEKRKRYEFLFIAFAACGVLATIIGAYRGGNIGQELSDIRKGQQQEVAAIKNIEHGMKTPRALLQIDRLLPLFRDRFGHLQINSIIKNHGDLLAVNEYPFRRIRVFPLPLPTTQEKINDIENLLWAELKEAADDKFGDRGDSIGPEQQVVQPITGIDSIPDGQWKQIQSGTLVVYFAMILRYKDDQTGAPHETDVCRYYWGKDPLVFHHCETGHNDMW